jgi:transposase, IS5 family
MAFKNFNENLSFADLEPIGVLEKNRAQGFLEEIKRTTDWTPIQEALIEEYPVGQSTFGNKAYPPIILLKAMLLQKCYGIDSDPELENQINDRLSFKRFIGIPLRQSAPSGP